MSVTSASNSPFPPLQERENCKVNPFMGKNWEKVCSSLIETKNFLSSYLFSSQRWPSERPICSPSTFVRWEDTDLEVIPDHTNNQALNQIRKSDAVYFSKLYTAIANDESRMKIVGSLDFKKKLLENIKILLTRPLGRQLIGSICSLNRDTMIQEGEKNKSTGPWDGNSLVFLNFDPNVLGFSKCQDSNGAVLLEPNPAFIALAHEFIHVLHLKALKDAGQDGLEACYIDLRRHSPDPVFTNLNEQLTIAGLDSERALPCENALRAEFGMPARVAHHGSEFPSYTPKDHSDIDTPNERGATRLANAVHLKVHGEICKLLDAGANPGNAYCAAIVKNDPTMIQFLLERKADPNKPNHRGNLPLLLAVQRDQRDIAKLLIENGARVDQHNARGETALQVALKNQNIDCALLLITNGAFLTEKDLNCLNPMYHIEFLTRVPHSRNLTDRKIPAYVPPPMNVTDNNTESTETKDAVSKKLPYIDRPNERGVTRLANAVNLKADKEILNLLAAGANPGNAYCAAIANNDQTMIQFLLEHRANPNTPDDKGDLPLHQAAQWKDRIGIVTLLITGGARALQRDASGQTALQVALKNKNGDCALLLITKGRAPLTQKALECLDPKHRAQFLTRVPPLMNFTDNNKESTETKDAVSTKLPPQKRVRPEAGADLPEKKFPRHQ